METDRALIIGNHVKFYFRCNKQYVKHTGIVVHIYPSALFADRAYYIVKDDLDGFEHAGYREDFSLIDEEKDANK